MAKGTSPFARLVVLLLTLVSTCSGGGAWSSSKAGGLKLGARRRCIGRGSWVCVGCSLAGFIAVLFTWAACGMDGIMSVATRFKLVAEDKGEGSDAVTWAS